MKKLFLLFTLLVVAVFVSAQRPNEFFKTDVKYSVNDILNNNKNYDSTFRMAPTTFNVTGPNFTCADSLTCMTYSATKHLFLFGTSQYYGRYAQKFTAPYAGRIDSVEVLVYIYSKSTSGQTMNLRIHSVDPTHLGPVTTTSNVATPWTSLQIYNDAKWPVYKFTTPVTFTQGQQFFIALSMPNPANGDTASLLHMSPYMSASNCLTVTDSTVWGYTGNTTYNWSNCTKDWGFPGTIEIGILPYFTYTVTTSGLTDFNSPEISLFPNPATTNINITGAGKNATVVMTNAIGQVVYQNIINDKATINTLGMSKGLYFVRVNSTIGKVVLEK